MTNSIDDLGQADVVLVVGSNTTEAHPIIGVELKKAALHGTRIFVVDPRQIRLTRHAEKWLPVEPGANIALVNAMMRIIIEEGLADDEFISARTEGFEAVRALVADYDLERAAELTGLSVGDIRELAIAYGSAERASIVYAMGVTQHETGTTQVRALANLAMLTGNVGRPGTGVNPLRGQNNVQGACDLACLPDCLPGYQKLGVPGTVENFCDFWETPHELSVETGLTLVEMMDAAIAGELRAMYIMGENPVIADPDQAHVLSALQSLDFLVVQDIFMTETASLADVVLPAASFLEKDGTFTNTDRRIKRARKVIDSPGEALADGDIIVRLSHLLGIDDEYASPAEVMFETSSVRPQYGGVSYPRLEAEGEMRGPCPDDDHPGTAILHAETFTRGLGEFAAVDYVPPAEQADEHRPLILTTGRHLWNFHTNTMTRRTAGLSELNDHGYLEMNPTDARDMGICDGDEVEVTSAHGSVRVKARVDRSSAPKRGVVFMPCHFADASANRLTAINLGPTAKIPGLKVTAVEVRKVDSV